MTLQPLRCSNLFPPSFQLPALTSCYTLVPPLTNAYYKTLPPVGLLTPRPTASGNSGSANTEPSGTTIRLEPIGARVVFRLCCKDGNEILCGAMISVDHLLRVQETGAGVHGGLQTHRHACLETSVGNAAWAVLPFGRYRIRVSHISQGGGPLEHDECYEYVVDVSPRSLVDMVRCSWDGVSQPEQTIKLAIAATKG